jgi:hypothetical protein
LHSRAMGMKYLSFLVLFALRIELDGSALVASIYVWHAGLVMVNETV